MGAIINTKMKIFEFEQKRAIQTLIFIANNEKVILKDIMEGVGGAHRTIQTSLKRLVKLDLVEDNLVKGKPSKRIIKITPKGKSVSDLFRQIEEKL